jgi:hypothetical protein
MTRPTETPTPIVATVWRYNGRRYLQKRAAFMAAARDIMREGHRRIAGEDFNEFCDCKHCADYPAELETRKLATEMARAADRAARVAA